MFRCFPRNQTDIDISPVVINQMSKNYPDVDFRIGDVTKLEFEVSILIIVSLFVCTFIMSDEINFVRFVF